MILPLIAMCALTAASDAGDPCSAHWIVAPGQPGMDDAVRALAVFDADFGEAAGDGPALYAGGDFSMAGGIQSNAAARWDGVQWRQAGIEGFVAVSDFEVFNHGQGDELYASAFALMRYDGIEWTEVPGAPSSVHSGLGAYDGPKGPELFVSGGFIFFNTPEGFTEYIARWNGSEWHAAGDGLISVAQDYTTYDDGNGEKLIAVGSFGFFGDGPNQVGVGQWDGATWSGVGGSTNGGCHATVVYDDGSGSGPALYVGGGFTKVGINTLANSIARWNGTSWSALGSGIEGVVYAMSVFDDGSGTGPALYVGGTFQMAGGVPAANIARWDGSSWSAVGGGANGAVFALKVFQQDGRSLLAAAGDFTAVDDQPANHIAFFGCDAPLSGDLDHNGVVDVFDLVAMLEAWGDCGKLCPPAGECDADIAGSDCTVDVLDLILLLSEWE